MGKNPETKEAEVATVEKEEDEEEFKEKKKSKKSKKSKDEPKEKEEVKESPKREEIENESSSKKKKSKSADKEKESSEEKSPREKEKVDDTKKEENKKEVKEPEIHTANNWEGVEMGDQNRKMKFLKLMGAFKHQDDKSAPPVKQRKTVFQSEKLNQDLEKQFIEGVSHKHQRHSGLGFAPASSIEPKEAKPKEAPKSNTHITFEDE